MKWSKEVHTIESREGYSFYVNGREKPLRAWELLPVEEPVGDREQEVQVAEVPVFHEPVESLVSGREKRKKIIKVVKEPAPAVPKEKKEPKTFLVEKIEGHKFTSKGVEFLVKYKDFPTPSWQPARNLKGNAVLAMYLSTHPRLHVNS